MEGFGSAKVPKPRPVDRDKMHLCSMIRLISMGMAMCLGLGHLEAQTAARSELPQPFDLPLNAENAWPSGTFGVDYNVADQEGFRHGPWVRVYPDGALYYSGTFDHGLPVGSWWFFRENGTALSHVIHEDNDPTASRVSTYAPDGRITAQGGYLHGTTRLRDEVLAERPEPPVRHGVWSLFSSSGNLTALMHYDHGKKHGLEERYLPSGATCERGNHVEGELNGEWLAWHDNGMLRQRITYRNGVLDGPFQAFYGGGGRMSEGEYLDGAEEGSWKFYLEDGRLQHIHRYRAGTLLETIRVNGTFVDWHGEERPAYERSFRDKKLDGPFREWHDQGGFVLEAFTDPETGEQMQRRVMSGTQVSREGEYVDGVLDGPVYRYDQAGRLTYTEHYTLGHLDRTETH